MKLDHETLSQYALDELDEAQRAWVEEALEADSAAQADLAVRAGTSPSTIARLEKGERGVGVGTLSDILVVFGLVDRLADLVEARKDELGMALDAERLPRRGRSSAGTRRTGARQSGSPDSEGDDTDRDGVAF